MAKAVVGSLLPGQNRQLQGQCHALQISQMQACQTLTTHFKKNSVTK